MTSKRHAKRTPQEAARVAAIKELGCIICRLRGLEPIYAEEHHLLHAGRVRGHMFTIGINQWTHRAVPVNGLTHKQCRDIFGPSLAEGSKPFHAAFGSDDFLLGYQNDLLVDRGFPLDVVGKA